MEATPQAPGPEPPSLPPAYAAGPIGRTRGEVRVPDGTIGLTDEARAWLDALHDDEPVW